MANSDGPLNSPKPTTSIIVGGVHNTVAPAPEDGQALALQQDQNGNLLVNVAVGGGSGSGNVNITGINSVPPALTNPLPVELSDGTNAFGTAGNPLSVNVISGGGSNASVGLTGAAAPTSATEIGIVDGTGKLQNVSASTPVPVSATAAANASGNPIFTESVTGSTTAVTQTTASNLNAAVVGTKTNNNAAPGATNLGVLPAIANAAVPTWVEGDQVLLSEDLSGNLRVKDVTLDALIVTEGSPAVPALRTTGNLTNNANPPSSNNFGVLSAVANAANPSWVEGDQVLVSVDLAGRQRIQGQVADEAAFTGNPITIAGVDGSGNVELLPVAAQGDTMNGVNNVLIVGGVDGGGLASRITASSPGNAGDGITLKSNSFVLADGISNTEIITSQIGGTQIYHSTLPFVFGGTTWDRQRSATVGNAVAATGLAAAVGYVQYNTTLPAPAAAQYTAAQCDTTGSTYVNIEGRKATYSAFASFTAVAGDIAVLPGSASKTIRVTRVEVSFVTSGTAAVETVQLVKRSAADTGGTSAAMTAVPHDSGFAGASAAPLNYTVAPTPGAAVGTIRGVQFNDASSALPGANTWIWDFGTRPSAAIVLRGVAQMLCVSLPAAVATQTAQVSFEWSEE